MAFGKHAGKTLSYILANDPSYAVFVSDMIPNDRDYYQRHYECEMFINNSASNTSDVKADNKDAFSETKSETVPEMRIDLSEIKQKSISDLACEAYTLTPTLSLTLELYNSGKTIDEIALERKFVRKTIEGHIARLILMGKISNFPEEVLIIADAKCFEEVPIATIVNEEVPKNSNLSPTLSNTLNLYKEGKTIEEIASLRKLTKGTIENHVVELISLGAINDFKLDEVIYNSVIDFYSQKEVPLKDIKAHFDETDEPLSYYNIKCAIAIFNSRK